MSSIFGALGHPRTEDAIIARLPHYPGPYDPKTGVWGDPDQEFVGSYVGSQAGKTGYGIYEGAIERFFQTEIPQEEFRTRAWNEKVRPEGMTNEQHLTYLLDGIKNGAHVIVWGDWCTDPWQDDGYAKMTKARIGELFPLSGKNICRSYQSPRGMTWKTPEGKRVQALSGDHVFILLGYVGSREHPTHIIVWDTDTGRHVYTTQEWMRKWSMMQYRSFLIERLPE